jgi:NAD(P)-dependent dehydrogenase (short-subunit alcohol dehydrogenase family)
MATDGRLKDKVAIVTGAGSRADGIGIGRTTAIMALPTCNGAKDVL